MKDLGPFPDRYVYPARIAKIDDVHDGDTVRAVIDLGFEVRVTWSLRLLGIQAPEVGGPNVSEDEKRAGLAARDVLRGLVVNPVGELWVRTERDRAEGRGRYLATLLLVQDGKVFDVNELLVRDGHATPYDGRGRAPKWTPTGWIAGALLLVLGLAGCAGRRAELPPAQRCRVVLADGATWWGPTADVAEARARWYVEPSWRRAENVPALGYGAP